jgi:pullulanase/glycogen debranching enzyme
MTKNPPSRVKEGSPAAHGAIWDGKGTNITLFSAHAIRAEMCLFASGRPRYAMLWNADRWTCTSNGSPPARHRSGHADRAQCTS